MTVRQMTIIQMEVGQMTLDQMPVDQMTRNDRSLLEYSSDVIELSKG